MITHIRSWSRWLATFRRQPQAAKKQDDLWAVREANFTIMPGETVGFIGRNGGGKSTLLKLATRIYEPTEGHISVHGRTSALLELGAGFHPDLTGHENIFLNGALLGLSEAEVRAKYDAIVDFSEMRDFLHMPVKFYSSGMYMRLAFSVAVHVEPDILFVDEILAVGDQAFQSKMYRPHLRNQTGWRHHRHRQSRFARGAQSLHKAALAGQRGDPGGWTGR